MELLIETLNLHWADRQDVYVGGNMFVYFSPDQIKNEDFRGPDFYLVLGVDGRRERKGWVVWEEGGKTPDVIIELLSESTADFDKKEKKEIYRTKLGAPEYFWFDPFSAEWAGFVGDNGEYVPLIPDNHGRLISPATGLALVRWEGEYQNVKAVWLRWETLERQLLKTNAEYARLTEIKFKQAENRAEQAENRAELLAAKLRELGIEPESLK
jgi:Uma2 family endonuclease